MNDFIKIKKYENRLFSIIDCYEKILDSFVNVFDSIVLKMISIWSFIFLKIIVTFLSFFGMFFRYTTYPLHWITIHLILNKTKKESLTDLPLFQVGAHYIYGKPGSGKSTSVYKAMMDYARHTGKCSYTTEMMETPRRNMFGAEYFLHQLFEPSDFYHKGEQIQGFDSKRFNIIVYEEMLTKYHQRNNNKNSFNDEVLPMVASIGTQRHQGIDLFYFLSQLPKNDISIMQLLTGYHIPKIKKKFDYRNWLRTGGIRFSIVGWNMISYEVAPKGGSDYELTNKVRWFYPNDNNQDDMVYFNRLNMKSMFDKLTKFKGREMTA